MNNIADKKSDPRFLDNEEQNFIESLNNSIESGNFVLSSDKNSEKSDFWKKVVSNTEKRRAITLRLQNRDISRIKVLARKKGLPYQTYISSVLHQLANGDLRSII